jgi:hypothetical protein
MPRYTFDEQTSRCRSKMAAHTSCAPKNARTHIMSPENARTHNKQQSEFFGRQLQKKNVNGLATQELHGLYTQHPRSGARSAGHAPNQP